jgi:hypothetical protein
MNNNFKVLNEDDQKIYNKWVKGIAKQDAPSQVITVDDIINRYRNTLSSNAPKTLPYGLENLLNEIGNIFIKAADIRFGLSKSVLNPVISEHKDKIRAVREINKKMEKIQEILFSTTEDMNKIVEK